MATTKVEAKCVGCGAKRDIGPNEVTQGEQPMCTACGMPMVAVKAKRAK